MAWTYEQLIAGLHTRYATARIAQLNIDLYADYALGHWGVGEDHEAIRDLISGLYAARDAFADTLAKGYYGYDGSTFLLPTALDLLSPFEPPEPYELTMAAIIEAMAAALPHEPLLFVGYLEAFKASCWNSSFDETFFADLVKKWSIWD